MVLRVIQGNQRGWTVLHLEGEVDLLASPAVRESIHEAVAAGQRRVILDLSRVRLCDSSGVGMLVAARRLMRSCRGELRLVMPERGAQVNRVFAALGVRRLFDIFPELASAVDDGAEPLELPA